VQTTKNEDYKHIIYKHKSYNVVLE